MLANIGGATINIDNYLERIIVEYREENINRLIDLYDNIPNEKLKVIFSKIHFELNVLFKYLNERLVNGHYTAYESRELIKWIDQIDQIQSDLKKTDLAFEIDPYYKTIIKSCNEFLQRSGGSPIPPNFEKISLILAEPVFILKPIGKTTVIEAPKVMLVDVPYIQRLRERCSEDLKAGNYDSVITKSRTLIEEVLIYILEKNQTEIESKGDLNKLYSQIKKIYNMNQNKDYDGRVNSLLSGLGKIVQSIAEMRNMNSDAHGVGTKRIDVREHEAQLIINSAITFSEYILFVA